jgi:hypothetical protein
MELLGTLMLSKSMGRKTSGGLSGGTES